MLSKERNNNRIFSILIQPVATYWSMTDASTSHMFTNICQ